MASAKPIAMLRFSAKIETSVNRVITRSTAIEPRIANTPTASGRAAAINPPNTQTNTTKLSGIAMDSIVSRSFSLWPLIWTYVIATPPARTVTPSRSCTICAVSSLAYFWASLSPPVMPATISPVLPSLLISAGAAEGGAVHAEVTCATCGDASSCAAMSVHRLRAQAGSACHRRRSR